MSFVKNKWKLGKVITTVSDLREAERVALNMDFDTMDVTNIKSKDDATIMEFLNRNEDKVFEVVLEPRKPIIDEDSDDTLFGLAEDLVDRFESDFEHLTEDSVETFIKDLLKHFEIKKK